MKVTEPQTKEDFEKYYRLRWEMLRKPWKQAPGTEKDEMEHSAIHAFIENENKEVVAVGRLHFNSSSEAQVRYMAVHTEYRGKNMGKEILNYLEQAAIKNNASKMILQAREEAVNFYIRNDYEVVEKTFLLYDSVQHYLMQKLLK